MRKIHPGFTALAVLLGPASGIIAHQKATEYFQQKVADSSDPVAVLRQAQAHCSELTRSQRPSHCDKLLRNFEQCAAQNDHCDSRSVDEVLVGQNFSPTLSGMPKIDRVAVTGD